MSTGQPHDSAAGLWPLADVAELSELDPHQDPRPRRLRRPRALQVRKLERAGLDPVLIAMMVPATGTDRPTREDLPPDHPARTALRGEDSAGALWHAALAATPADSVPSPEALSELEPGLSEDPAIRARTLHQCAVQERRALLAGRARTAADRAAALLAWLDSHRTELDPEALTAQAPAALELAAAESPPGDPPPDQPPPPQRLALTTSVLTAAPPAPAPPVQGVARAVLIAA